MDHDTEQALPVAIAEAIGQRHGATPAPLMREALTYASLCAQVYIHSGGELPFKMDAALDHVCNYIGITFKDAVLDLHPELLDEYDCDCDDDEDDDLDE